MSRVAFLIDGFNLYYSVREASEETGLFLKWVDLAGMCRSYLSVFGKDAMVDRIV